MGRREGFNLTNQMTYQDFAIPFAICIGVLTVVFAIVAHLHLCPGLQ